MRSCSQRRFMFVCSLLIAACTADVGEPVDASSAVGAGTLAVVQLERWTESQDVPSHLLTDARIASYRGIDGRGVERLLGAHGLEVETCGLMGELPSELGGVEMSIELLDVGPIEVLAGDRAALLQPRVFPAVAGTAHGVFYVSDTEAAQPRAEQDDYLVSAPGNGQLGTFDVGLSAPSVVEELAWSGLPADANGLRMGRRDELELTWAALDPRDRVEFEWIAGGQILTCVARDDGHFVVPAAELAQLPADDAAQLTVRRVRLAPFDMQGVELAYVRAVAATLLPVTIR